MLYYYRISIKHAFRALSCEKKNVWFFRLDWFDSNYFKKEYDKFKKNIRKFHFIKQLLIYSKPVLTSPVSTLRDHARRVL